MRSRSFSGTSHRSHRIRQNFSAFFCCFVCFRWHHCVYVIFINGSVRTYLAIRMVEVLDLCMRSKIQEKFDEHTVSRSRASSVRWCEPSSNRWQTSSDNKCWMCALLCGCRGGGANLRQFVCGIQTLHLCVRAAEMLAIDSVASNVTITKHERCESDLRHTHATHVEHAARTHIGIDFSRSFLIPTRISVPRAQTRARAHAHSRIPRRYTRWKTSRMCFWLWWWRWHGQNHACIFVERFSNFPCDGHSLAAIAFSPRRKVFRSPRECVYVRLRARVYC